MVYSHICEGKDFFQTDPPKCDYIISNPPYSIKSEVMERLFQIGKPFAMLINVQGIFDAEQRFEMFRTHKFELLYLYPRVDYIKPNCDLRTPFQSAYICSNILDKQIEFEYINKVKEIDNEFTTMKENSQNVQMSIFDCYEVEK